MIMTPLTIEELKSVVKDYVQITKTSNPDFSISRQNVAGLLDKIGKITMLSQSFVDKLDIFEREFLSYGKTIEEWAIDLTLPEDYDETGKDTLAPHDPSYRPVFYSYTLGRKNISTTRRYNDLERAVSNDGELSELLGSILKSLYDSELVWRYNVKRGIVGNLCKLIDNAQGDTFTGTTWNVNTSYNVGDYVQSAASNGVRGVVFKSVKANQNLSWNDAVTQGYVVVFDLITKLAPVTDTLSGERFVKQLKNDVEIANDNSQGHSLNGNALGAQKGLVLLVKHGIMPTIDVNVLAGAFHESRVIAPVEIIPLPDFADAPSNVMAVLLDRRAIGLHPTYRAVREDSNGKGDFINYYLHTENTAYISRNAFVKMYVENEE